MASGTSQKATVNGMALAAFMLPALALTVPSGYSIGALMMCGLGLLTWMQCPKLLFTQPRLCRLALAFAGLAALWAMDAALSEPLKANAFDRPAKFALALLAMPAVVRVPPPVRSLTWGVWLGALGAALTAAWQVHVSGLDRAWGYTNAIQFGNLALLLAVWSWLWAQTVTGRLQWLAWAATAAGLYAAVASESRGGWWVALVLFPLLGLLLAGVRARHRPVIEASAAQSRSGSHLAVRLAVVAAAAVLLTTQMPRLAERSQAAWQEVQLHQQTGESSNSVGQRLAHWKLAWQMGLDRPLSGWGEQGYQAEKALRVANGDAPEILRVFQHAHNEWLDVWAKHGSVGLVLLMALYAVPGMIYWQALRQAMPIKNTTNLHRQLAAASGLALVVGYVGFGMTQVMFAHNSSIIMYLFMNVLWMGMVLAPDHPVPGKLTPEA